jgi:hypothetical protein
LVWRNRNITEGENIKTEKLELKNFVKRISTSNKLYLVEDGLACKVKITKSGYGGFRTDRVSERNKITNALGFKHCEGREFMNCEEKDGSGTYLANVLEDYGKETFFIENGTALSYQTDIQTKGGDYLRFHSKKHFKQVKKPKVKP